MKTRAPSTRTRTRSRSWVRVKGGQVLACIDMGTNSFHMIVCRASGNQDDFEVITRVKEAVPFFRRSLTAHFIDQDSLDSAVRILKDMKQKAEQKGATVILAVATSAVRESKNGNEVLARIRDELGIDARMISGQEEARLIYLGVLWSMPKLDDVFTIVDIGGGSTEIIVADRHHTIFSESYKLGAARLTQRFFRKGLPNPLAIKKLHDEVRGVLRPAAATIAHKGGFSTLIGTSGTVLALAKLDRLKKNITQAEPNGYVLTYESLAEIVADIEQRSLKGIKIEGISSDRGQTILAGSIVLLETMRSLVAKQIVVCSAALREGVVVDRFLQTGFLDAGLARHKDPRSDSVHKLIDKYQANTLHAEQVARIAGEIFKQGAGILHNYPESAGHLLWSAAMLHDIGAFIQRTGHHKHSFYLIKNGGLLGHSEEEVDIIANIARYHRASQPKDSHATFVALRVQDRKLVADMAAILRIAEALDRSHRQVVDSLHLVLHQDQGKDKRPLRTLTIELFLNQGETCEPEIWAVAQKKEFFEQQFQLSLALMLKNNRRLEQRALSVDSTH